MNRRGCGLAMAFACAVLTTGTEALAERHETRAFSLETPPHWSLRRIAAPAKDRGTWMLASPSRDSRVLVHVGQNKPGDLEALFDHFVETHLRERVRGLRITRFEALGEDDGLESATASFYGLARRHKNGHLFKLATYFVRAKGSARYVALTLLGTEHAWGRQAQRFQKLIDSLELK